MTVQATLAANVLQASVLKNLNTALVSGSKLNAVNVEYLDNTIQAFQFKVPVRATSFENLSLDTIFAGTTLDGISHQTGFRILLKDQTNPIENGIYVVQATAPPTRTPDMAHATDATGAFVLCVDGVVHGDQAFTCTNNGGAIVDTNSLTFRNLVPQPDQLARPELVNTDRTLSVNVDNSTIVIENDVVKVPIAGITNTQVATRTLANDRLVNDTVTVTAGDVARSPP